MAELTIDQAKRVYREAIDSTASDANGEGWWAEVVREMREVCAAATIKEAADVIDWWHNDWAAVNDAAKCAAKRIRQAAKTIRKGAQNDQHPQPLERRGLLLPQGRRPLVAGEGKDRPMNELSEDSYEMLRAAVNAARQFQCRSVQALKDRLQAIYPGREAAIDEAVDYWAARVRKRYPQGVPAEWKHQT